MFAVFEKSIARIVDPITLFGAELRVVPGSEETPTEAEAELRVAAIKEDEKRFNIIYPNRIAIILPSCVLSSGLDKNCTTSPSNLDLKDGLVCMYQGTLENKEILGIQSVSNKASMITEVYRKWGTRNENENSWYEIVQDFKGTFSFIMFDARTKTVFVTTDSNASIECFWGRDIEGNLIFSTNLLVAKECCHKFYGAIPGGCFFATGKGLRNFQSPNVELQPQLQPAI